MIIKNIALREDEDLDGAIPETITVEMTARELVWIAKLTGRLTDPQIEEILPGYRAENHEVYSALTGDVANRFYDDGVDGMELYERR